MASAAKVLLFSCLLLHVSMQMCSGSAIPIWEFLTRNEKMSYLYSTFAQLVSVHCKATAATTNEPVNQCKRNLLSYGYDQLQKFSDSELDAFDPYQRGANELIWSSIMRNHPSSTLITTRKPVPTPPATSIIILTHQKPVYATSATPNLAEEATDLNRKSEHQFPRNPLFDNENSGEDQKHQYAMDMDIAYGYSGQEKPSQVETFVVPAQKQQEHHSLSTASSSHLPVSTAGKFESTYLTGPLVFRLRPDGSPVEEDLYKPLPRDDDLEAFQTSVFPSNPTKSSPSETAATASPSKHRKIATISALKQQHLANLALQRDLQPPAFNSQEARAQRRFQVETYPSPGSFQLYNQRQ